MVDLLARGVVQNRTQLARYLYVSRTRINQYLDLLTLPVHQLPRLKATDQLEEHQFRLLIGMAPSQQVRAIGRN